MFDASIATDRLLLLPWQTADWPALRPIATDPEVMRYINGGVPWTDARIRTFVERQRTLYRERGYCRWKLIEKASGAMIGFCGPGYWKDADDPEIGWWLARRCWGRGLATEAAAAALRDAYERAGLDRIISVAMPENRASTRIMEKLGLVFERSFESDGFALVQYAIDRAMWSRRAAAARVDVSSEEATGFSR